MATISRAEMQAAIAAGGVVLHAGRVYHDPKDLPTDAELAISSGDPAKVATASVDLEARIAALQEELAALKAAPAPAPAAVAPTTSASATPAPTAAAPPAPAAPKAEAKPEPKAK